MTTSNFRALATIADLVAHTRGQALKLGLEVADDARRQPRPPQP